LYLIKYTDARPIIKSEIHAPLVFEAKRAPKNNMGKIAYLNFWYLMKKPDDIININKDHDAKKF
tara:strand:+ start:501 stop:692 length:192 start_codon:yes stop_codon:yes gene_type:complete